jgi:hypothetical protein
MTENNNTKKQYLVEKTLIISAQPNDIFNVLMDFERWNRWTRSITEMSILNNDRPGPGAKIRVLQPKLSPAVWTIAEINQNKSLTWEKRSLGLTMLSEHLITNDNHETNVTIRMTYKGPFAGLFYRLTHSLTDRYMAMEINGLKRECERG